MKKLIFILSILMASPVMAKTVAISGHTVLKAGDYVWNDTDSTQGSVKIQVNLSTQMIYVYRDDTIIGTANISSGRKDYDTPIGMFSVLGKEENHWSKHYKAEMPFTMWLTNDGVALHSGITPGYKSSHGCIHLPNQFAIDLFQVVDKGTVVTIEKSDDPVGDLIASL